MKIALLAITGSCLIMQSCAPSKAASQRTKMPLTLGIPGAEFRWKGAHGIGGRFTESGKVPTTYEDEKFATEEVEVEQATRNIQVHYHFYPWKSSAFFVGLGASQIEERSYLDVPVEGFSLDNLQTEQVISQRNSQMVRIPLGWSWIWESGFTLMLDFGPSIEVASKQTVEENELASLDREQKELLLSKVDRQNTVLFDLGGVIGWSF